MRKVATIPIQTAAELVADALHRADDQAPQHLDLGGGPARLRAARPRRANYLMQSYSQIRDPELSIGQLRSLGDRLDLPQGWTYRSRRLKRDLTLHANGTAT